MVEKFVAMPAKLNEATSGAQLQSAGCDPARAKEWPQRFLEAIPVGADLSLVWPKWMLWILLDETQGVFRHLKNPEVKEKFLRVTALFERWIASGVKPTAAEFGASRVGLRYRW